MLYKLNLRRMLLVLGFAGCILFNGLNSAFSVTKDLKEHGEWNPVSAGPVTAWTAPVCGKGKFVVQPFLIYNRTRGVFDSSGHYDSLPAGDKKYQLQQQLFMQYGITGNLEVDGQAVYQENYVRQGGVNADASGFGDSYLFLRYCAVEENGWLPHLTGLFQVKSPTGRYQHAEPDKLGTDIMGASSGGGSWDHGYGILLTRKLKPFMIHADAVYNFPQKVRVDGTETLHGKYLNYDFGTEYFLLNGFNLMLEFNGFLQEDGKQNGIGIPGSDINYFTASPGFGWSNDSIQTLAAYQRTLTGTNTEANDSVVFTFVYMF